VVEHEDGQQPVRQLRTDDFRTAAKKSVRSLGSSFSASDKRRSVSA